MFYPKSPFTGNQLVESQLFSRNQNMLTSFLEWLCHSPSVTTYRVNNFTSSFNTFRTQLENILSTKYQVVPRIYRIPDIPEVVCVEPIKDKPIMEATLKEVMVDVNCAAALLRGAHIFAPGVLSMQSGTKLDERVNVFADLDGKCRRGTTTVFESDSKVFIGIGEVRMMRYQLFNENVFNRGIAVKMHSTISGVPSIGDLSSESALLQNFPSIVCGRVLDPKPGEVILDMCAAPGNKTTHIAELTNDNGIIIAVDKTENRAEMVRMKIRTHNLKSVEVFAFDSTKLWNSGSEFQLKTPPFASRTFDRILLDAPCSGLGNRPLLSCRLSTNDLKSYPKVQKKLFKAAVELLKSGGTLVYSTCSITETENEDIVQWALRMFPEMKLVEASPIFGGPGLSYCNLSDEERYLVQRFGPKDYNASSDIDAIGFFIAKFMKI